MTGSPEEHFRREIRSLGAYEVEEPSGLIKLDANENPYPPPEGIMEALAGACRSLELNRYPDPAARRLRSLLADRTGWDVPGLMLGNGSDELIANLLTACGHSGARLLVPSPTFAMYRLIGLASGWEVEEYPLNGTFDIERGSFIEKVRECRPRLVIVAWPNNPTGNCVDEGVLEALLEEAPGLVVIDEAYFDFSTRTFLPRLREHRNLVILRTLSKIGLAALRLGYLLADPAVVAELNKVRLPYNVSSFSQAAASIVLEKQTYLEAQIGTICSQRAILAKEMGGIQGVRPFPSEANFILFRTERPSSEVFDGLKERGVLVRDLGRPGPLENCLRVTVGTPEENRTFLDALKDFSC
jgi:histidinol-phosphate aminotransferase